MTSTQLRNAENFNFISSIGVGIGSFQDGRHGSKMAAQDFKMAAMAPIQAQLRVTTSDDPVTRSVSPRKVS